MGQKKNEYNVVKISGYISFHAELQGKRYAGLVSSANTCSPSLNDTGLNQKLMGVAEGEYIVQGELWPPEQRLLAERTMKTVLPHQQQAEWIQCPHTHFFVITSY